MSGKTDPLIKSMRKVYRSSKLAEWTRLLQEESRWKRKLTIAQNKLAESRKHMEKFTTELVGIVDDWPPGPTQTPVAEAENAGKEGDQ